MLKSPSKKRGQEFPEKGTLHWTKPELAYAFGVDERTVGNWQADPDDPLPVLLRRTARANIYDPRAVLEWYRRKILREIGVTDHEEKIVYAAEKARLTKLQADKAQLDVDELEGRLVRTDAVKEHWVNMAAGFRAKLLALPSRVAMLVSPDRRIQVQQQAQGLVYEALNEIASDAVPTAIRDRANARATARRARSFETAADADDQSVGGIEPDPVA
jgi:phage terminase Nu1 subunit (DNA packaging protein)